MKPEPFSFRLTAADVKYELINLKQLVFEVTDACNLCCKYCIYGELYSGFDQRNSLFLPFKTAKAVIDYLADIWNANSGSASKSPLTISFYGGEPLMNFPLIQNIVDYILSLRLPKVISFSMTTNCVLLASHMDYLVDYDFNLLCSLDGDYSSNAHRVYHDGRPSYDRVFNNLKILQAKHPLYFAKHVQFNAVLHNLNNVPGIIAFFKKEFGKTPTISELSDVGVREDKKSDFITTFRSMSYDLARANNTTALLKELNYDAPETNDLMFFLSTALGNYFETYADLLSPEAESPLIPSGTCLPFSKKMFIKVDGKILPCERIHHHFFFGTANNETVNLDLQAAAEKFNTYLDKLQPRCSVCASMNHCSKCFYSIEGIDSESTVCESFVIKSKLKQQEEYYKRYLFLHPSLYKEFIEATIIN